MNNTYVYLIILLTISRLNGEESRFSRIIRLYDNYDYIYETRNVFITYETTKYKEKEIINSSYQDTVISHNEHNNIVLAFQSRKNYGSLLKNKGKAITAAFNSIYKYQDNSQSNSAYFLDTAMYLFEINGKYNFYVLKYFIRNHKKRSPFIQIFTTTNSSVSYLKKNGYDPDFEQLDNDTLKCDWVVYKKQSAKILLDISPGIGTGKQINVTSIYYALKLEEKLIKNGIADFRFSDKTLVLIAKLLAKNNSYKIKKYKKIKELKTELDSILIKDAAIELKKLRYISPLEIKKILLRKTPVFMSKPRLRLFTTSRVKTDLSRKDTDYPYNVFNEYNDTPPSMKFDFLYEHILGLDAVCGVPLTQYWFLNISAVRNLISTDKEIDFYDHNKHIKWDEVLDIRWDLQTSFWITYWLLIQAGLNNLPAWLAVPREWPYKSYLDLGIFIEDYLLLTTAVSHYRSGYLYHSYNKWSEPINRLIKGTIFSITATYNF